MSVPRIERMRNSQFCL